jgi:hypothetical protein
MNTGPIMRRAWQFYRDERPAAGYSDPHAAFGYCLKVAWAEARGELRQPASVISFAAVRARRRTRARHIVSKLLGPLVLRPEWRIA